MCPIVSRCGSLARWWGCISHAYEWVYLNGMNIFTASFVGTQLGFIVRECSSPLREKQNNNRNKRCQSQYPTGVVLDRKKDWRRGRVCSEMCFVCVTLELAGLFESPTFRRRQREDKIGSYLNMATGEHKPTFAQVFHECNLVFQRTSNCAEEMAASA